MNIPRKKMFILLLLVGTFVSIVFLTAIVWILIIFRQFLPLIPYIPTILGMHGEQTYVVLFQNNMELRPGGGFIGSYADITVNKGRFGSLHIHNTYDADGQLRQHVEPYYIGRRFLQKNLYMRDSNFNVDFEKNAQKVLYMYQLETGHHANGVIAVDLSYIQSIVEVLSPLYVWQYNKTVTQDNFFLLTESQADKNSFGGSTQKQDFLKSIKESMVAKLHAKKLTAIIGIVEKSLLAISQKHLLIESENQSIQSALNKSNVSSTLYDPRPTSPGVVNDFLGVNEANIGVNKANYFLKRAISQHVTIQNSGVIEENVHITYTNTSQKNIWPTGPYAAYVRIIVPQKSTLTSISFDGKAQHIIPAVTDYHIYEKAGFVAPSGLEVDHMEEEGKIIYGFRILVDIHSTLAVDIVYELPNKITTDNPTYDLILFKQPGMDNDPLAFSLSYSPYYKITNTNIPSAIIKIPYTYLLQTTFLTDKHIVLQLAKK